MEIQKQNEGEIFAELYDELRGIARGHMRKERSNHTLQPTALVNEAFVRLMASDRVLWRDRNHFLCLMASVMRRVLIDAARTKNRQKRGGDVILVELNGSEAGAVKPLDDVVAVHEALEKMAVTYQDEVQLIELRFFAGLTIEEAAEALEISVTRAKEQWRFGRAWLYKELEGVKS